MKKSVRALRGTAIFLLCLLAGLAGATDRADDRSVMEIPADPAALAAFKQAHAADPFLVFTDDRLHSVRRNDIIPARWVDDPNTHLGVFTGTAQLGEFYVFQLAVWANKSDLAELQVSFSDLHDPSGQPIPAAQFRCLSLGGIGPDGQPFTKAIGVPQGKLQTLWVGVDVPADRLGKFVGVARVSTASVAAQEVTLNLTVDGPPLTYHGDGDAWRLSRLRWLDSTVGREPEDRPTRPFTPIFSESPGPNGEPLTWVGRKVKILGREILLGEHGLPAQVSSDFNANNTALVKTPTPLLARPMRFVLVSGQNTIESRGPFCQHHIDFDGHISYRCRFEARDDMTLDDLQIGRAHV